MALKQTHKDFEKWALPVLQKIQKKLLLEDYHPLTIKYRKEMTAYAECAIRYPYKSIEIRYSTSLFEDWCKGEDVKNELTHEMCHVVTDPFYCKAVSRYLGKDELEDERERLTDHIANIVLKQELRDK